MRYFNFTYPTPQENLACDEALLEACEAGKGEPTLRFWESPTPFVALGYANQADKEADKSSCEKADIPILRRVSGGGTVLQGPGCLNYSLILEIKKDSPLRGISQTNKFILRAHKSALEPLIGSEIRVRGDSDLTLGTLKFSGNAQRRRKKYLLYHGTFLYNFDIAKIARYLNHPVKEPAYRKKRPHSDFLTNLSLSPESIQEALKKNWGASENLQDVPLDRLQKLVETRYSTASWNTKF